MLSFDLPVLPIGMGIDPVTGVIVWTPTAEQVDQTFDVVLRVRDAFGGLDLQPFSIKVAAANSPPEFMTVAPAGPAVVAKPYRYNARAYDPNGDAVRYTLYVGASGAIFALFGVVGALRWRDWRRHRESHDAFRASALALAMVVQIGADFLLPMSSLSAHLSGFVFGLFLGALVTPKRATPASA